MKREKVKLSMVKKTLEVVANNETQVDDELERLDDLLLYDIEDLIRITKFKEDMLKEHFLHDPRILRWQRRAKPRGKRVWLAKETRNAIREIILNEWSN